MDQANVTLNLVVLRVVDPERSLRFYEALGLAFVKERHGTGPEHYASQIGNVIFELYPRGQESGASTRIGFRVPSVDVALSSLQSVSAEIIKPASSSPWRRRAVVRDPDGHQVEITEAVDEMTKD